MIDMNQPIIIGNATLYLADCREVLPSLPKADGLLLDPPFENWDKFDAPEFSTCIAFCNPKSRQIVEKKLGKPRSELVWHFADGRWVSPNLPRITHDYIYVYGDLGDAACGEAQEVKTGKKGNSAIGKDRLGPRIYTSKPRKHLNSVLIYPRNMRGPLGAWGKPQALINVLCEWADCQSWLDPFMGSGTTGVATVKAGRKFIGIESDPKHFDIACEAIEKAQQKLDLFD